MWLFMYLVESCRIEIELPEGIPDHIRQIYAHQEMEVSIKDRKIYYRPSENKSAVTLWLE